MKLPNLTHRARASFRCASLGTVNDRRSLQSVVLLPVLFASMGIQMHSAQAYTASVTSDISQSKATVPATGYGIHTSIYDNNMVNGTTTPAAVKASGATTLRYPGGTDADVFHWQTMSFTAGVNGYLNSNDTFDNWMTKLVQPAGCNAIITCNYGTNAAGTGGADPNEAAAWVDYANNTKHYGIKYWEIGNEVPGNGFYGAYWEADDHYTGSSRTGQSALGPVAYGQNVVQFVNAMKAKDSTIKVGIVVCTPGSWPDGVSPDWNTNVFQQCGTKIDFVIIHWYPGGTTANALASSSTIASTVSSLQSKINQYCGSNAPNVKILITETNAGSSAGDGPQQTLFSTDNYLTWFENGALNVDWLELHSNYLSEGVSGLTDDTPGEGYYGAKLASDVARVGDTLCSASSNNSLLKSHVVNRTDNSVGVQLVNDDPSNSATVTVTVNNATLSSSGTRHDFGVANFPSGSMWPNSGMSTSTVTGIGTNSFTVTVPAYTASNIIIPKASGGSNLVANGTYTIVGVQSGKALDDPAGSTANGTQQEIWTINGGNNQKWQLTNLGNNVVKLINVTSGLALEVNGGSTANGAKVDQWSYGGTTNQQWTVVQVSSGVYNLKNVNSGEVLDVIGGNTANGTLMDQWPSSGGTNQQWKFQ